MQHSRLLAKSEQEEVHNSKKQEAGTKNQYYTSKTAVLYTVSYPSPN